jgi:deoxyribose-phosphate aldolase
MKLEKLINEEIERVEKNYKFELKNIDILPKDVAQYIDHTILNATATPEDIEKLCKEAADNQFFSVCVNPIFVPLAAEKLNNTGVKIATVIGFPLGATDTGTKAFETSIALNEGADEFDMVINVGMLKSKKYEYVYEDIKAVVDTAENKLVKVIIETCYLERNEIIAASLISKLAGAHFVKTSTGFGTSGAKAEDVNLMKFVVGENIKVKASGGIRNFGTAKEMICAGAERIGASAGIKIINGEESNSNY